MFSPMTRLARITLESPARSPAQTADRLFDERARDRRRPSARRPAPVRASPCRRRPARRARAAKRGPFLRGLDHDARRHGPAGHASRTMCEQHAGWSAAPARARRRVGRPAQRRAEDGEQPPDFARPAAGKHEDKGRIAAPARRLLGDWAAVRRCARRADGRHRDRAVRQAADARRARTARSRARNRHKSRMARARPGRQAQTEGET